MLIPSSSPEYALSYIDSIGLNESNAAAISSFEIFILYPKLYNDLFNSFTLSTSGASWFLYINGACNQ
mgnify:CR=1 FL=1